MKTTQTKIIKRGTLTTSANFYKTTTTVTNKQNFSYQTKMILISKYNDLGEDSEIEDKLTEKERRKQRINGTNR